MRDAGVPLPWLLAVARNLISEAAPGRDAVSLPGNRLIPCVINLLVVTWYGRVRGEATPQRPRRHRPGATGSHDSDAEPCSWS